MQELIEKLSKDLRYVSHEYHGNVIEIRVCSRKTESRCPYCGRQSDRVHSRYVRKLQDLPIQGAKVKLLVDRRKYFCDNAECSHGTFAELFDIFDGKATKTKRLEAEIMRVSLTQSSTSAARYLRASVADVGKSTICALLKKGREKEC